MPLHEYECQACGARLEVIQKFSDPHRTRCPKCKGRLKRLLSAPGIHFKGSGWYITDYARKGSSAATGSSSEGGSSSESKPGESKVGESKAGEAKTGEQKPRPSGRRPRRSTARRRQR